MAASTAPIFCRRGDVQWTPAPVVAANTTRTLAAGTSYLIFTADATEGGRVEKLVMRPLGTNIATVLRLWIVNTTGPGVEANAVLFKEYSIGATTVSEVAMIGEWETYLGLVLPPGYSLYCTLGTAIAAGVKVTAVGGKY